MKGAQFVVGIDLGTTHSALAAALLDEPRLHVVRIPQLLAPGELCERDLLPSFLYLPQGSELSEHDSRLPWGSGEHIVGELARKLGSKNPNGLVASAKSWICHGGVNRRAAILPWGAPDALPHVSPYHAQVAYLRHLRSVWEQKYPDAPLNEQEVVVTVPASFDESARILTSEAASEAGLGRVKLLEEPQAAFYDYLGSLNDASPQTGARSKPTAKALAAQRSQLSSARLILVVDVGGGTTDLTLLRVLPSSDEESGVPTVERIAVGGHLMLGGDNMDAALAFYALEKAGMGQPSDATLWSQLAQSARNAKERLLSANAPEEAVISYQGRGSSLIGNTKSIVITREEAVRVLLDGCFPCTGPQDLAQRTARAGLTTLGLPYTSDTAVPRHICSFLRRHASAARDAGASVHDGLPRPDLLLLNGGVFRAPAIVNRLLEALSGWYQGSPPALLEHVSLDTSVARGAVWHGLALRGVGTMIRGGSAKAYYVGLEHEGQTKGLCIAPRNLEPGTRVAVEKRLFQLRLNEPVVFPLFAYTGDRVDPPGTLVGISDNLDDLTPLAPLETLLRGQKDAKRRENFVSVSIESFLDEAGNLKIFLVSAELPPRRWTLDFVVRKSSLETNPLAQASIQVPPRQEETAQTRASSNEHSLPAHPEASGAALLILNGFNQEDEATVGELRRKLEAQLGGRGSWSLATCRVLSDACLRAEASREKSESHELNWLRLLSWTLRPGFGAPGDQQRLEALFELEESGPARPNKTNWAEWWILWRRIAPGLDAEQQVTLFERVRPWLWPKGKAPPGPKPQGQVEMLRMLAALERLPQEAKTLAGAQFLQQINKLGAWPLGRVGARVLFHGTTANVLPNLQAQSWLEKLLELDWQKTEGAAFAAASLARVTTHDHLNVEQALREKVADRLAEISANPGWIDMVLRPTDLDQGDVKRILGDSLPAGLRLSTD